MASCVCVCSRVCVPCFFLTKQLCTCQSTIKGKSCVHEDDGSHKFSREPRKEIVFRLFFPVLLGTYPTPFSSKKCGWCSVRYFPFFHLKNKRRPPANRILSDKFRRCISRLRLEHESDRNLHDTPKLPKVCEHALSATWPALPKLHGLATKNKVPPWQRPVS